MDPVSKSLGQINYEAWWAAYHAAGKATVDVSWETAPDPEFWEAGAKSVIEQVCAWLRTTSKRELNSSYDMHEIETLDGDGYPATTCAEVADAIEKKFKP